MPDEERAQLIENQPDQERRTPNLLNAIETLSQLRCGPAHDNRAQT